MVSVQSFLDMTGNIGKVGISMKKLYLFLTTLLLGGAIMSYKLFDTNFSSEGIQEWALDALLIAAILGFIATKWLKKKGKLD